MSKISGNETKPEINLRKALFSFGYRYRKNYKKLPGKPDVTFLGLKKVIFVHGCFWHQHKNCKKSAFPRTNKKFWVTKLEKNRQRDARVLRGLKRMGYKVLVIWECQLQTKNKFSRSVNRIIKFINN